MEKSKASGTLNEHPAVQAFLGKFLATIYTHELCKDIFVRFGFEPLLGGKDCIIQITISLSEKNAPYVIKENITLDQITEGKLIGPDLWAATLVNKLVTGAKLTDTTFSVKR